MPELSWRPATEAQAVGAAAVFLEWLHAVHGVALAGPAGLAAWRRAGPAAFAAAIAEFAGLDARAGVRDALLRGHPGRIALILPAADGARRAWTRGELLGAETLPEPVEKMLAALPPDDLPALAASHLLDVGTAPDACLAWAGDPAEPWPLGAWLVGAAVMLAGPGVAPVLAAPVLAAPNWRG